MRAEYNVTYREFVESVRGYRRISRLAAALYWFRTWVLPSMGVAIIGFWLWLRFTGDGKTANSISFLVWLGAFVIVVPLGAYVLQLRAAFRTRTSAAMDGHVVMECDEREIVFSLPSGAAVRYPWTAITAYRETPLAATLFVSRAAFHTIPSGAMTEEQWKEFRALIMRHAEKA